MQNVLHCFLVTLWAVLLLLGRFASLFPDVPIAIHACTSSGATNLLKLAEAKAAAVKHVCHECY